MSVHLLKKKNLTLKLHQLTIWLLIINAQFTSTLLSSQLLSISNFKHLVIWWISVNSHTVWMTNYCTSIISPKCFVPCLFSLIYIFAKEIGQEILQNGLSVVVMTFNNINLHVIFGCLRPQRNRSQTPVICSF